MQIASNNISAVKDFYKRELAVVYMESELANIIIWVLEKQLKIPRSVIDNNPGMRINESDMVPLERMCHELKTNRPWQYVLGETEFYGLRFKVDERVLIPRPETEELVEKVLKNGDFNAGGSILDIGTGSGCIPIAIKKNIPEANVFGVDISEAALALAAENAALNGASVLLERMDILAEDAQKQIFNLSNKGFDVIISNPPYVLITEKETLHPRVREFEPAGALFVEASDPLVFYRKIVETAKKALKKGGKLYFECHSAYASDVQELMQENGFQKVILSNDLAGLPRFTEGQYFS